MPKRTKIKIDDRIQMTKSRNGVDIGDLGTVRHIKETDNPDYKDGNCYAIEFDKTYEDGHDCDGHCIDERGLWMPNVEFKVVPKGKKVKIPKKMYHVVCVESNPKSVQGVVDSFDAATKYKPVSEPFVIYEMIPIAKIERSIKVSKIKAKKK